MRSLALLCSWSRWESLLWELIICIVSCFNFNISYFFIGILSLESWGDAPWWWVWEASALLCSWSMMKVSPVKIDYLYLFIFKFQYFYIFVFVFLSLENWGDAPWWWVWEASCTAVLCDAAEVRWEVAVSRNHYLFFFSFYILYFWILHFCTWCSLQSFFIFILVYFSAQDFTIVNILRQLKYGAGGFSYKSMRTLRELFPLLILVVNV